MKVSVNWLRQLVAIDLSVDELAHTLTMAGLEVEDISPVAPAFDRIVVGEVKTVAPHPNADKLRVTEVDVGSGDGRLLQIVCGAPNVVVGMRAPVALVGAKLPGLEIKEAKLRGVDSRGMLCSARELGISEEHAGLLALPADAPVGRDIRDYLDLNDVYLTLKLTPNRGDCLSMAGIARDLAAVTGAALKVPDIDAITPTSDDKRPVKISAPKACGRYLGRVIKNINAQAATPEWMKRRLERAGFRSIAPLVDITNYLTLAYGRPMHAFDLDKLKGGIDVRYPLPGEAITLLNEQQVVLQPDMLLITDEAGPVAIGGVMGGLDSMVTPVTTNVLFESAYFDPAVIQGKTRVLGINSDAAFRFERGVDPESVGPGIEYATRLTLEICGTPDTRIGPVTEANGELPRRSAVLVRPPRVERLIGTKIAQGEMANILRRLQCIVVDTGAGLLVTPPSFRFDLAIEEDFIEEIARIFGYDKVPAQPPKATVPMLRIGEARRSRAALRRNVAGLGYQEVINYSFVPREWEQDFAGNPAPITLLNPISSQMSVMRSTLIGGLIGSLQHNLNRGESRLKLFELGRCFMSSEASVEAQPERIGGLAYGARSPEQWGQDKAAKADFFAIKGDVEAILAGLVVRFEVLRHPALHPGRAAAIRINDRTIGFIGELHPQWQQKHELPSAPVVWELAVETIREGLAPHYRPISRMQAVRRDIAVMVPDAVVVQTLIDTVKTLEIPSLVDFALFDVYRGNTLASGLKSLAFRIVMQDTARTLTDSECDQIVLKIVEALSQKHGATLRK
ncbi:MAG TPA: phenylalanine--tRNA ligase subunit beta [Usitatibacteraceae bacterium]